MYVYTHLINIWTSAKVYDKIGQRVKPVLVLSWGINIYFESTGYILISK